MVGGPVWWHAWRPTRQPHTAQTIPPGRRVYLVAFFGISAVVALIALLIIGYRLFEFLLGEVTGGSLLDRTRAPLGLLVAAGLVAGYHFALWRREHALLAAASPAPQRTIDHVTLVLASDPEPLARAITSATGAKVAVWKRADAGGAARPAGVFPAAEPELVERVVAALAGVAAERVLLVIGPADGHAARIEVIPLETTK
jgi:hypothetical protein